MIVTYNCMITIFYLKLILKIIIMQMKLTYYIIISIGNALFQINEKNY